MAESPFLDITVVIPAYNRARLVERSLASVAAQTSPADAVLVVDDGSTDGTADVAARVPGVTVIRQPNGGAGAARDNGMRTACTRWVAFLDSDDEWDRGHLERLRAAIAGTAGAAVLYFSDTQRSASEGGHRHWSRAGLDLGGEPFRLAPDGTDWALMRPHPMMLQSSLVSRAAALEMGGFWRELRGGRDDTHFLLGLSLGRPICAVAGVGAVMHEDADQRLGERHRQKSEAYWTDTVALYRGLRRMPGIGRVARREFRRREADGWIHLSEIARKRGDLRAWAPRAAKAVTVTPAPTTKRLARKVRGALS